MAQRLWLRLQLVSMSWGDWCLLWWILDQQYYDSSYEPSEELLVTHGTTECNSNPKPHSLGPLQSPDWYISRSHHSTLKHKPLASLKCSPRDTDNGYQGSITGLHGTCAWKYTVALTHFNWVEQISINQEVEYRTAAAWAWWCSTLE